MHAKLALDVLEQDVWSRSGIEGVVHHSDHGSQLGFSRSIRHSERLAEVVTRPSVGSVGDSYDNALTDTIIDLYTRAHSSSRPFVHFVAIEYATLERVDWHNHRRWLEPIGNIPPSEFEASYDQATGQLSVAA